MPGELYQIFANKEAINNKRKTLDVSSFGDQGYWSSKEYSSNEEFVVYFDSGDIYPGTKNFHYGTLGFLALELK